MEIRAVGDGVELEHEGRRVGHATYRVEGNAAEIVTLCVDETLRRQGLGRYLMMSCLKEIASHGAVAMVYATGPEGFLSKQGFRTVSVLGEQVRAVKKLTVCA
jgi:N-acetylglutamate synthase-like GNAT family acetyltransferase